MKRGIMALLLMALVLALSGNVSAAQTHGSVEIRLDAGELPVTNGAVTMYLVGIPTGEGYRLLARYGGGVVRGEDLASGNLAVWLGELADGGKEQLLDVDGRGTFSGLEAGLYLVEQSQRMDGFYPFRAFLAQVPEAGQWTGYYEPVALPITDEVPGTGDLITYLAALAMMLSGGGLVCCGIWEKREKS